MAILDSFTSTPWKWKKFTLGGVREGRGNAFSPEEFLDLIETNPLIELGIKFGVRFMSV